MLGAIIIVVIVVYLMVGFRSAAVMAGNIPLVIVGSIAIITVCVLVILNGIGYMTYRHFKGDSNANATTTPKSTTVIKTHKPSAVDRAIHDKVTELRKAAMADMVNGEWGAAIEGLEAAIKLSPDDKELKDLLNRAVKEREQSAAAEEFEEDQSSDDDSFELAAKEGKRTR